MKKRACVFMVLVLIVILLASLFASDKPDGLEFIAEELGFIHRAADSKSVLTDYTFTPIKTEAVSRVAAGILGILLCLGSVKIYTVLYRERNQGNI